MEKKGGKVTLFTVDSGRGKFDVAHFADEHYDSLHIPQGSISWKSVQYHDVPGAILEEAATHDLVVIGITNLPRMYRAVKSAIPEIIASSCPTPLVLVKAQGGIMSMIRRFI